MPVQFPATRGLFYVPLASLAPPDREYRCALGNLTRFFTSVTLGSPLHILLTWFCSCCCVPSPPNDLGWILTWKCFLCPQWPLTLLLLPPSAVVIPNELKSLTELPSHCSLVANVLNTSLANWWPSQDLDQPLLLGTLGLFPQQCDQAALNWPHRGLQSKCLSLSTSSAVRWPEATQGSSITPCLRINSFCIQSTLKGLK